MQDDVTAAGDAPSEPFIRASGRTRGRMTRAGVWSDSSKSTPSDTVAGVRDHNGSDRTPAIKVLRDTEGRVRSAQIERRYGVWYLPESLADTADRALRFRTNPRVDGSRVAFRRDTLRVPGAVGLRRRWLIRNHEGQRNTRDRVLLERSA